MLSGRGIDGELKSKFGEWSEKFWQSGVMNGNLRAIYLANEGGSGGEGKKLEDLRGDDSEALVKTKNGDGQEVQSAFGICIGDRNENGSSCRENDKKASVVMVGDDPNVNSSLTWEQLKEQNWGQTSLVRSRHSYEGLFKNHIWKGNSGGEESKLNRQKIQDILIQQGGGEWMRDIMCPWIWSADNGNLRQLRERCGRFSTGSDSLEGVNLIAFLNSNRARKYFKANAWDWRGNDWEYLALLTLLNLWTNALSKVNFDSAANLLNNEVDKFKLEHLMNSNGKVIYLDADNSGNNLKTISYHSGGNWEVQLCPSNGSCSNGNGLNLTLGDGKFCVIDIICLDRSLNRNEFATLKNKMNRIYNNGSGTWGMVFGSSDKTDHLERLLVALLVACFKDVESVSLTVQEPPERGELIFIQLNNEK